MAKAPATGTGQMVHSKATATSSFKLLAACLIVKLSTSALEAMDKDPTLAVDGLLSTSQLTGHGAFDLTDDVLVYIFNHLAAQYALEAAWSQSSAPPHKEFSWFRQVLPLVCKRWRQLLSGQGGFAWRSVILSTERGFSGEKKKAGEGVCVPVGLPGSSPTLGSSPTWGFTPGAKAGPAFKFDAAMRWLTPRTRSIANVLLEFEHSSRREFDSRSLGALLKLLRGSLRRLVVRDAGPHVELDAWDALSSCRGLQSLHLERVPNAFLHNNLPELTCLAALTRFAFRPDLSSLPTPARLPSTLPPALLHLSLHGLLLPNAPSLAAAVPQLQALVLEECTFSGPALNALVTPSSLKSLSLSRCGTCATSATGAAGEARAHNAAAGQGWGPNAPPQPFLLNGTTAGGVADMAALLSKLPRCGSLTSFSVVNCWLRMLHPDVPTALPALSSLDLSHNPEMAQAGPSLALPASLDQLPGLARLSLSGCGLSSIPHVVLSLRGITYLDLEGNSLSTLPLNQPHPQAALTSTIASTSSLPCTTSRPVPIASSSHNAAASSLLTSAGLSDTRWSAASTLGFLQQGASEGLGSARTSLEVSLSGVLSGEAHGLAASLVYLNMAVNRFSALPQGLAQCSRLETLVIGNALLARLDANVLALALEALPQLRTLRLRSSGTFEARAVASLLVLQQRLLSRAWRSGSAAPRVQVEW